MMGNLNKFLYNIKKMIISILFRNRLLNKEVTIISNNCWGGTIYKLYGCKFNSPTIGLYIMPKDFVKLTSNMLYYMNGELKFITFEESKYYEYLIDTHKNRFPLAKLFDIEIHFMHYKSEQEAYEKWEKRKKRINYTNIVYKMNNQNMCTLYDLNEFDKLDLPNKLIMSNKPFTPTDSILFTHGKEDADFIRYWEEPVFNKKMINFLNKAYMRESK